MQTATKGPVHRFAISLLHLHKHKPIRHAPSKFTFTRNSSVVAPRPYTFHIGANWAGKLEQPGQQPKVPFPAEGLIGSWRDKTLAKEKDKTTRDPGEDFFFVQQVISPSTQWPRHLSPLLKWFLTIHFVSSFLIEADLGGLIRQRCEITR